MAGRDTTCILCWKFIQTSHGCLPWSMRTTIKSWGHFMHARNRSHSTEGVRVGEKGSFESLYFWHPSNDPIFSMILYFLSCFIFSFYFLSYFIFSVSFFLFHLLWLFVFLFIVSISQIQNFQNSSCVRIFLIFLKVYV